MTKRQKAAAGVGAALVAAAGFASTQLLSGGAENAQSAAAAAAGEQTQTFTFTNEGVVTYTVPLAETVTVTVTTDTPPPTTTAPPPTTEPPPPTTTQPPAGSTLQPGASLDAAYDAAAPGAVIALANGSFGNQTITGTKAAPGVTFRLAAGATVTFTDLDVRASNVTFDGLDADGVYRNRMRVNGGTSVVAGGVNVVLRGLHMYATATITWGNIVFITNATNVTIEKGEVGPAKSSDGIDIWPGNNGVTIRSNHIHHITEVDASDHPDAIQSYSAGTSRNPGLKILGNVFDNNVNSNVHCDSETVGTLLENNIVYDTTATSGIPAYTSIRCMGKATVYSYNTFPGNQPIQTPSNGYPQDQQYVGNVGASVQNCVGGLFSRNVWTGTACNSSDKKVTDRGLTADGHLTASSPAIGYGDSARFPTTDIDGQTRTSPPDAGADER